MSKKKTIHDKKYTKFIENLISIRMSQNITQRDLATKLDVSQCYVGRIETCERRLDILETIKWCQALNQTSEEIIKIISDLF